MASYLSALVVAVVVCLAHADVDKTPENSGFCKSVVQQDLKIDQLKGTWWEQESYNTDSFVEPNDKCHVSYFYPSADKKKIEVSSDYVNTANEHKKLSYVISDEDPKNDGNLVAVMKLLKPALGQTKVEWDVLKTDHKTWILVKICLDLKGKDNDFKAGLLLVKDNKGVDLNSDKIKSEIEKALKENQLTRDKFVPNDIKSCTAVTFPEKFTPAP